MWPSARRATNQWLRHNTLYMEQFSRDGCCGFLALREYSIHPRRAEANANREKLAPRLLAWRQSLPSVDHVVAALKQSCKPEKDEQASLDWRHIVAMARHQHPPSLREQALTDTFGRRHNYLRISLTERCNLRCLYCMPESGVELTPTSELLHVDEIEKLARLFASAGVTKIRLTGGEPTVRRDLVDIVARIAAVPGIQSVGITSNGIMLGRILPDLQRAGLTHVNISLDTLQSDKFESMTRRKGHHRVLECIHQSVQLGFDPVKVNVVVMRGINDDEIGNFVDLTKSDPINVRFIEYMPFDGNVWSSRKLVSYKEVADAVIKSTGGDGSLTSIPSLPGEVAKNFKLPGHAGSVSFVTSMTSAFCSDCTRLRLMADGNLKVCLFGANEVSLRDALREGATDDDLYAVISAAVDRKKAAHAGMFELSRQKNRAMVKIGG